MSDSRKPVSKTYPIHRHIEKNTYCENLRLLSQQWFYFGTDCYLILFLFVVNADVIFESDSSDIIKILTF